MCKHYLKIMLSGPLMHFSKKNNFSIKDYYPTETSPTRSAVVGLLGNALGLERGDPRLLDMLHMYELKYRRILTGKKRSFAIGDKPFYPTVIFEDFQCVSFGDEKGKNLIKRVEYICDEEFEVFIGADMDELRKLQGALLNPAHPLYIGKYCCYPSKPILNKADVKHHIVTCDMVEGEEDVYNCI